MVAEKVMRFQGRNKDLQQLSQRISQQLQTQGYKTQLRMAPLGTIIQAQKGGILSDIITAERAFTILIAGQPNDFTIHVGIGKWIQNIAVAAAETLLISWLFLAIDIPEMLWTQHVEGEIIKEITQIVAESPQIEKASVGEASQAEPQSRVAAGLCSNCGYQNDPMASFCIKCGTKLK